MNPISDRFQLVGQFFSDVSKKTGREYTYLSISMEGKEIGRLFIDDFKSDWIADHAKGV